MCRECAAGPASGQPRSRRRRLWEIEDRMHCPLIGTCLTLDDLKRVLRQSGVEMAAPASDFEYHVTLVRAAGRDGRAARNMHKLLERRYARHVRKLSSVADEAELRQAWQEALPQDEMAGTLWAVLTHPQLSEPLTDRIYGELHMLSHLAGRSRRRALGRIPRLQMERDQFADRLEKQRLRGEGLLAERDRRIQALERQVREQRSQLAAAALRGGRPEDAEPGATGDRKLARERRRRIRLEAVLGDRNREIGALQELLDDALASLREQRCRLARAEGAPAATAARPIALPPPDLSGRHVVYVGGRPSLTPHLRAVVEGCCARFTHHDGGLEESGSSLECKLQGADLVFCPVDCISHDACQRVKRCCKRNNTPFVPLRSSGVSGLIRGLTQLGMQAPG